MKLRDLASRFSYKLLLGDGPTFPNHSKRLQAQRLPVESRLHALAVWKAQRAAGNVLRNDDVTVENFTRVALRLANDSDLPPSVPIAILTLLDGVRVPTASVILTVWHPDRYGIIDRNAWSALFNYPKVRTREFEPHEYDYYVQVITELGAETSLTPRQIDMALWTWWTEEREKEAAA